MGTLVQVEKSTLRAMMLEILLKDKEFFRDILQAIIKEDPNCLEGITSTSSPVSPLDADFFANHFQNSDDIEEEEARKVAKRQFEKYSNVFKALA
jgi:hypothetical protein